MTNNPYAPPRAPVESASENDQWQGAWVPNYMSQKQHHMLSRRWGGAIVDLMVCFGLAMLTIAPLGDQSSGGIKLLLLCLTPTVYFTLMEGLTGYSVGKFIFRVKVVNQYGQIPGVGKAFIRSLLRLLEVNPFLLGGIPAGIAVLFSKKGQRLGDMAADTYVLATSARPPRQP